MEKHAACAAPMSSSGVLPSPALEPGGERILAFNRAGAERPAAVLEASTPDRSCLLLDHGGVPFSVETISQ